MPKSWYDTRSLKLKDDDSTDIIEKKELYLSITASKKPYFMNYIYPQDMNDYKKYLESSNKQCLKLFGKSSKELLSSSSLSKEEQEWLDKYHKYLPNSMNNCVMNRLCRLIEREFHTYLSSLRIKQYNDFKELLKANAYYDSSTLSNIKKIYKKYREDFCSYMNLSGLSRVDSQDKTVQKALLKNEFIKQMRAVCSNDEENCNALVDTLYENDSCKQFVWDVCSVQLIQNIINNTDGVLRYCVLDDNGAVEYCGENYTVKFVNLKKGA